MTGLRIDMRKLTERLPGGVREGVAAVDEKVEPVVVELSEVALFPLVSAKVRACTIPCDARVLGIADQPRIQEGDGGGFEVVYLRLDVERPEGAAQCCVRQAVPRELWTALVPGVKLKVLAHESDPSIAVVDWDATGKDIGARLNWVLTALQFEWPDRDDWPAEGAIEVHDKARHRKRIEKRRAEWTATTAHLVSAKTRGAKLDDREQWNLELDLDGRRVSVKERVPALALVRLVAFKKGEGTLSRTETVVRSGATVAALLSAKGEVAIDWDATLRQPELLSPEPL